MNKVRLGDVCRVERGASPRPINNYITTDSKGINWIKIGDTSSSKYITKTEQKITLEGAKKSRFVKKGDFLLSNSMSFGRPYILKIDGCIHDGWLVLHDTSNSFEPDYLYHYLSSPSMYNRFKDLAVGGVVNNLNSSMVKNLQIELPPIDEQRKIANILDKADSLLLSESQRLTILDELVKSRFVEMFGDPVTNNLCWKQTTVGDLCFVTKLAGFEYTDYIHYQDSGDVIMIRGLNVKDKKLKLDDIYYIDSSVSDMLPRSQLNENDIVMTYVGVNIGDVALVDGNNRYHLAPNVAKISPNNHDSLNSVFFVNLLAFNKENYASNATNTAKQALNMNKIRKLPVMLPPIELQNQFVSFVVQVDKSKSAVKQSIEKLETLKKSLMQEYFG
ncbi:MAG: restriction endonuclease subunit S [Ruminococcus sp.]|uniref:restriction endonuclease subunit S n=1 Tax=Ruminococcus sp. TaxID=41978 RepID=UPI00287319D1|nr:restriction endonuclease subunit S [Ruminococcus sp.]MBQ3285171.1 restriction endonuclease subunit S [Ruminococcus sp.]